jgi:hypothetical protein
MGEHKAKTGEAKRLLLRLQWPTEEPLVVEMNIEADFLERVWKLMLICDKIRRTMHGRAKVIIENAPCHYIAIHGRAPIQRLLTMAKVKEWHQLQFLWIPRDFHLDSRQLSTDCRNARKLDDGRREWILDRRAGRNSPVYLSKTRQGMDEAEPV